jgi:hypothetical protein
MKLRAIVSMGFALLVAAGLPARADWTFTSGTTTSGSETVSATATFKIVNSTTVDLILANDSTIADIGQVLDALAFTVVGSPNSLTLASITPTTTTLNGAKTAGVTGGFIDCATSTKKINNCHSVATFEDQKSGTTLGSPYDWTLSGSYLAAAGAGSYKPGGIVNTGIEGNLDGLRNLEHNDYLNGPVTFQFTDADNTSAITNITGVTFYWGTTPDKTTGTCTAGDCSGITRGSPVPEPTSVALFAGIFLFAANAIRRKVRRA